ncbi:MAG: sugar nucleotide-binding protein [Planctomycetes bacterium]|nr:sugar nucleotide-binding protein [Planctomycetota bacterium]
MAHRVLVLGGSGWLGAAVVEVFAARFELHAPAHGAVHGAVDIADAVSVAAAIRVARAEVVVNLAAANTGDAETMGRVNALAPGVVAACTRAAGARLLHMSTDLVLDGRAAPYADDAPPHPVNVYGRTKAAGEAAVRAADPTAVILRTSLVFDPDVPDRFTRSVVERLARGESATLYTDEIRCPISRLRLAFVLAELVERADIRGISMNVAGTQALSRFDFAMRLLPRFGATRTDLVRAALAADAPDPRPIDLTLDVALARALLRTRLRSVDEELAAATAR